MSQESEQGPLANYWKDPLDAGEKTEIERVWYTLLNHGKV